MIKSIYLLFIVMAFLNPHTLANDTEETFLICKPDHWFAKPDGSDENTFIKFTKGLFAIEVTLNERMVRGKVDDEDIWSIMQWKFTAYESSENDSYYKEIFKWGEDSASGKNFNLNRKTLKLSHRSTRTSKSPTRIESNCEIVSKSKWGESLNRAIDAANAKSDQLKKLHEEELKI